MADLPLTPITLLMALAFCAVHIFIGKLRFLDSQPRSRWLSFAGGVAVGYVFLHILPELGAHSEVFRRATGLAGLFAEAWVYTLALAGLILFYGIERAVVTAGADQPDESGDSPQLGLCWVHIAAIAFLVAIVAYLLNHREDAHPLGLALYFGALLLHFVTADHAARTDHPKLYDRAGRWVLVVATLGGWGLGLVVQLSELLIGCLFAFVGGGIILVALKEELPEERESSFGPFLLGAAIYAVLVLAELRLTGG